MACYVHGLEEGPPELALIRKQMNMREESIDLVLDQYTYNAQLSLLADRWERREMGLSALVKGMSCPVSARMNFSASGLFNKGMIEDTDFVGRAT